MASHQAEVSRLISECRVTLCSPEPPRSKYFEALMLADAALELATEGEGCDDGDLRKTCEILQKLSWNLLRDTYAQFDKHERLAYDRATSKAHDSSSESDSDSGDDAVTIGLSQMRLS